MSEKISENAVWDISYKLYEKYIPRPDYPAKDMSKIEDQAQYARLLADSFANFHKAFYNRLVEQLSKDK